jgi:hypothetical protein
VTPAASPPSPCASRTTRARTGCAACGCSLAASPRRGTRGDARHHRVDLAQHRALPVPSLAV